MAKPGSSGFHFRPTTAGAEAEKKKKEKEEVEKIMKLSRGAIGFRFRPTDKVIVGHYLRNKVDGKSLPLCPLISDANVFDVPPWRLPDSGSSTGSNTDENDDKTAYYFTKRKMAADDGLGVWKPRSTDHEEIVETETGNVLGFKRSYSYSNLSTQEDRVKPSASAGAGEFHTCRWIMKEYSLPTKQIKADAYEKGMQEDENQQEWVLCKIKRVKVSQHPPTEFAACEEEEEEQDD